MKYTMSTALAAATISLFLAACGGGGGTAMTPMLPQTPETPEQPDTDTDDMTETPTPQGVPNTVEDYQQLLAEFLDRVLFGEQAAPDVEYVSDTGVVFAPPDATGFMSTFDGQRATFTVERGPSASVTLDSDDAYSDSMEIASVTGLEGRTSRSFDIRSVTESTATYGHLTVDWEDGNEGSYLAGGHWAHFDGVSEFPQVGAFVDGPELSIAEPADLPVSGRATYRGTAGGVFVENGDGYNLAGSFRGPATLWANFGEGTIAGCIPCADGDLFLTGTANDRGTVTTFNDVRSFLAITLEETAIGEDSTFVGVAALPDLHVPGLAVHNGQWGGVFSNEPADTGEPRLVAGAFAAESTHGNNYTAFAGSFAAGTE